MVFRANYNQQRAERDRAKRAKKEEKERERQDDVARRKAGLSPSAATADQPEAQAPDQTDTGAASLEGKT
jgi:hypothetical protein